MVPILTPASRAWLAAHAADDPTRLLLAAHRWPDLPIRALVAQLAARQQAKDKLPTWAADPDLLFPPGLSVEQASSEATARYKASLVAGAGALADLTGGFGVDAWHFAQTVGRVAYVEQNTELAALVAHNTARLGTANLVVEHTTAEAWLASAQPDSFDWLYLDPARRDGAGRRVAALTDCTPNVPALLARLVQTAPRLLLKTAPLLDLTAATRELGTVQEIIVVELSGEVKEVLYVVGREINTPPTRRAVLLAPDGTVTRALAPFTETEEAAAPVSYGLPEAYLFEPAAAVLKAGALRLTAARYGLRKLHPNSQLYTGPTPLPDWPGRQWRVRGTARYDRRAAHA
ncbi:MAG: hypothetical protein H7330_11570, partial [Hymenobacteraceae bacterium]|nr:hypothetical protein [Hymenobacteraceae bacterium]